MRIFLVRHGETYANTLFGTDKQILIGALDNEITQLNERGKDQAERARKILKSHLNLEDCNVYSSDLGRTKETSRIVFGNIHINYDARLRERTLGVLEGLKYIDVINDPDLSIYLPNSDDCDFEAYINTKHPTGESYLDVYLRCKEFIDSIKDSEKDVVIVSHFHTLRCFYYAYAGMELDSNINQMLIENANPYEISFVEGLPVLKILE